MYINKIRGHSKKGFKDTLSSTKPNPKKPAKILHTGKPAQTRQIMKTREQPTPQPSKKPQKKKPKGLILI